MKRIFAASLPRHTSKLALLAALAIFPAGVTAAQPKADLSRLVVIGDSLSAGFQNGQLLSCYQTAGYAAVFAAQAQTQLHLPLIGWPGFPPPTVAVELPPDCLPPAGLSGANSISLDMLRLNPTVQATNLAVPGHMVRDALDARPGVPMRPHPAYPAEALNALTTLVLGIPGLDEAGRPVSRSQVEWAVALKPTTVILWTGNNDALESVLVGDSNFLTPLNDFRQAFAQILASLAPTGASVLVGNIPDATSLPFVLPPHIAISIAKASNGQVPADQIPLVVQGLGVATPGTMVTASAIGVIGTMLAGNAIAPLEDSLVLTPAELAAIQTRIGEFNSVIATMARRNGVALVDINKLMKEIAASVPPEQFAGLFSPDLVHPNSLGHLILANEFIRALNQNFGNNVPEVPLP